ncbi:acyl-CoA carboxylase epsilon subunit [Aquipuribacter sp. MA13-6]|uniref:acyl-CoA carboxylase epsilon subunit n=1 Tax=unclassified Aquipuribacter TaxID=2635084 RepID=UPI003EE9F39B
MTGSSPSDVSPPVVQVVSGRPDAGELAAVVSVLLARAGTQQGAGPGGGPARGTWGAPSTLVRRAGGPPVGGWGRTSATLRG